jgi:hypothetical protein
MLELPRGPWTVATSRALALGSVLALGACSAPASWPGEYEGTVLWEDRDCDTGASVATSEMVVPMRIERDDAGLFINGGCPVRLTELSSRSARLEPAQCEGELEGGVTALFRLADGQAELDGDELAVEYSAEFVAPDLCLSRRGVFVGERIRPVTAAP